MSSSVSIVTVTYNSQAFIERFLLSVKTLLDASEKFSLVLVDNDSSDDTVGICQQFAEKHELKSQLSVIATGINSGFGAGCNTGAAIQPSSDYIWFLNPDTTIEAESGTELLRFLDANVGITAVGSVLKNEHDEKRPGAFRFPTISTSMLNGMSLGILDRIFSSRTTTYNNLTSADDVEWLTGASFMVRRDAFDKFHGFDPKYFLYFEEVDLFLRLGRSGHKFRCVLSSVIYHESGASTGINRQGQTGLLPRKPPYWLDSRRRFYVKNFGRLYLLLHDAVFVVASLLGRIKAAIAGKTKPREANFLRDIIRYSGWR